MYRTMPLTISARGWDKANRKASDRTRPTVELGDRKRPPLELGDRKDPQ